MISSFLDINRETYNKIARPFSNTRKYLWDDLKSLVKYVKAGDKVLDLGCGTGRLYQLFKDFQVDYTGVDFSEGQIALAKENYPKAKFIVAEMTVLPFKGEEFDVIFCVAVFHHLLDEESRIKALREMKRVLKNGGLLIMTNWNVLSEWGTAKAKSGKWKAAGGNNFIVPWKNNQGEVLGERFYHGFTLEELKKMFKKAGFELVEQYYAKRSWKEGGMESGNIVSVVKN